MLDKTEVIGTNGWCRVGDARIKPVACTYLQGRYKAELNRLREELRHSQVEISVHCTVSCFLVSSVCFAIFSTKLIAGRFG